MYSSKTLAKPSVGRFGTPSLATTRHTPLQRALWAIESLGHWFLSISIVAFAVTAAIVLFAVVLSIRFYEYCAEQRRRIFSFI